MPFSASLPLLLVDEISTSLPALDVQVEFAPGPVATATPVSDDSPQPQLVPSQVASPDPPLLSKRPRGAPPGNLNALKHGYYSHIVRASGSEGAQNLPPPSLQSEIKLLRLIVLRTVERCSQFNDPNLELRYLSVVSQSMATLSRLIKTDYFLSTGGSGQVIEQMALVAAELTREWDSHPTEPQSEPEMN